ncbi:molybdenum cofactor synthesis domain-containing protein [Robiginitomaculum antarcticum]|uniref:molybdenum cofactor synthesis domain-containing protein n=1 Tax=Robiginitomaculum antarcticum TaxID=437507 RepID=UPI000378D666|nr:molybdenum cofactor synthesis domain-containing protein [Robiginitomaculum antarcticum]
MAHIDESLTFYPINIAVLTVSDTRNKTTDTSGGLLADRTVKAGHNLVDHIIVKDEIDAIQAAIKAWVNKLDIDVILATGGTGFAPRDVTPEAVKPLFRREMDGFATVFHHVSMGTVGISTLQSRAFAGQIEDTFVFCVPGSTGACRDAWDNVFAFEFNSQYRPCSLVGQIERYRGICP